MKSFCYTIGDALGLHARPASLLVQKANQFACAIRLIRGENVSDAKKIFAVMNLGVQYQDTITVECDGIDEEAACAALTTFFKIYL